MKLSKLILSGFKSFADKTEFVFDEGISCIVGPNGCGKSNIADAVKWVLGEQSAKSLRGKEMMDVIFNGSSTRRASGGAEVTLVFDNSEGVLHLPGQDGQPCDVVAVTRRLFRSGLSEYLINKTPCRLRDIREMFLDTGNAYSLIEQGRVEGFLQATQEERRAIFDEAAGINKYKARKKEALRKIERVEQNLLRINDVFQEVEKRLRSIKYQAGKARNYQTYSEKLKELRSLHFLARYHTLSNQRAALQGKLDAANDRFSQIRTRMDQLEAAQSAVDLENVDLDRTAREAQGRTAAVGGQILTTQQRQEMLAARVKELGQQIIQASSRCEEMEAKCEEIETQKTHRQSERDQIAASAEELSEQIEALRKEYDNGEMDIVHLQNQQEDEKAGTIDLLRRTAELHNEIHGLGIRQENLQGHRQRLSDRADQIEQFLSEILTDRAQVQAKLSDVESVLADAQARWESVRQDSQQLHEAQQSHRRQLSEAREQRSALISRRDALQEMQTRLEGVSGGVRQVLQAAREGKLTVIRGMLGEFLQADMAYAGVVEAALAGADQMLLADRYADVQSAGDQFKDLLGDSGVVEVLCLDTLEPLSRDFAMQSVPDVRGCILDWVRFDAWLSPVLWRLLGRTLVVSTLADAKAAAAQAPRGYRFVTLEGQVLEADGRVRFGAANRAAGVVARRSELTDLQSRQQQLDAQIETLQQKCTEADNQLTHLDDLQQKLRTAIYEANTERVEYRSRLSRLDEQSQTLQQEKPVVVSDLQALAEEIETSVRAAGEARDKATELERLNTERQAQIERLDEQIVTARRHQDQRNQKMTDQKVRLAQVREKQAALREVLGSLSQQSQQITQDIQSSRSEIQHNRQRRQEAAQGVAAAGQEVDRLYEEQQKLNVEIEELEETRRGLHQRIEEIRNQITEQRKAHSAANEEVNELRLALGEDDVRVESLIARAADEMNMDLPELFKAYEHDEARDWDAVGAEITTLREKIERLGNVNLDAITEQEQLEQRRDFLKSQLDDIQSSQKQLEELIRRINVESRQMFSETFQAVRENFQQLFRKLFGGGKADIFLIDPDDVLESGIEIVARPPGKELRSLSLLSGGEKTLTALAMLFSVFRTKPSPFCLLDEVDAALDETNTERFSHLLKEFNTHSQFVVISHAKRTMSMANVLYGVTMQEAGVSKRISVRFEDAGHKLPQELQPVSA